MDDRNRPCGHWPRPLDSWRGRPRCGWASSLLVRTTHRTGAADAPPRTCGNAAWPANRLLVVHTVTVRRPLVADFWWSRRASHRGGRTPARFTGPSHLPARGPVVPRGRHSQTPLRELGPTVASSGGLRLGHDVPAQAAGLQRRWRLAVAVRSPARRAERRGEAGMVPLRGRLLPHQGPEKGSRSAVGNHGRHLDPRGSCFVDADRGGGRTSARRGRCSSGSSI